MTRPRRRAIAHGTPRRISLGRINGRLFAFNAGIGFDAELVRRVDAKGRRADGKRPGDIAFSWTVVKALVDHRFRYEEALEVEGLGRAAFALIANCSPYTYAGALGLRFVPGASFEGGLDIVAPIEVRPRAVPRLATQAFRGRPGADDVLRRPRPRPDRDPLRHADAGAGRRRGHRRRRRRRRSSPSATR